MTTYIFTFGVGQIYRRFYLEVIAPSEAVARDLVMQAHGVKWSMVYRRTDFVNQEQAKTLVKLATIRDQGMGNYYAEPPCTPL